MFGVSMQAGIFQNRIGRGRTVEVDVVGDDMNKLVGAAGAMFGIIKKEMPLAQVRPLPSLELLYPEVPWYLKEHYSNGFHSGFRPKL